MEKLENMSEIKDKQKKLSKMKLALAGVLLLAATTLSGCLDYNPYPHHGYYGPHHYGSYDRVYWGEPRVCW